MFLALQFRRSDPDPPKNVTTSRRKYTNFKGADPSAVLNVIDQQTVHKYKEISTDNNYIEQAGEIAHKYAIPLSLRKPGLESIARRFNNWFDNCRTRCLVFGF